MLLQLRELAEQIIRGDRHVAWVTLHGGENESEKAENSNCGESQ
jgi:hypothetical protein